MNSGPSPSFSSLREIVTNAIRYWEVRRIAYNLVLTAVLIAWLTFTWPHFREAMTLPSLGLLVVLAVLANLCYTAAYVADIPMQISAFQPKWHRWRWLLWLAGTLFAILLENYWIVDEVYPFAG
jgi:hypothetical protein